MGRKKVIDDDHCRICGKKYDFYQDLDDFEEYIRENEEDYESRYPDVTVCLSCAIDIYEERLIRKFDPDFGMPNRFKEIDPKKVDPSKDYWYDE